MSIYLKIFFTVINQEDDIPRFQEGIVIFLLHSSSPVYTIPSGMTSSHTLYFDIESV